MLSGTFIAELSDDRKIVIPTELLNRLQLGQGDKVEVLIKRIRSRRFDIKISKNPLIKLLDLSKES